MNADETDENLKHQLSGLTERISNPFTRFKYWIKEENLDLHAVLESINCKSILEARLKKIESKKKSANSEVEKLNAGKKTFKTLFKSTNSKATEITKLTNTIASCDVDQENYEKMVTVVTAHLAKNVIPQFKKKKINSYVRAIKSFSESENSNSNELVNTWSIVLSQISQHYSTS
jgi:septal ring factor EnvC (AmiA/AmiB activator)